MKTFLPGPEKFEPEPDMPEQLPKPEPDNPEPFTEPEPEPELEPTNIHP